ncbi:MAG: dihydroorotase [Thermoanaerobaculia bacterium]|nr:MAG: dihydroorotase [Thermoanaerobaculia bacterium]MBZ0103502.1 dihydroorotase [Thermoanaerobaculia bacterium]
MTRLLVRGGRVVDPSQGIDARLDLLLEEGRVARLAERLEPPAGCEVLEAAGKVVAPGLIDIHVHLREPGQTAKETIASGAAAAAAGGFTAVACMANTQPVNDSALVTGAILAAAGRAGLCRVHPIGAISKGLEGRELAPFGELVAAGCRAVSDDGRPVMSAELMRRALEYSQHFGIPVVQHAQDLDLSGDGVMHEGVASACCGMPGIPGVAEDVMVARDLVLLAEFGGRYHVAHLSTARSLALVREARARGLAVTCEVTPHHLLLTDRAVLDSGLAADWKMQPPLRSQGDAAALLAGLADGTIDAIATDHAPHTPDEKALEFQSAPFGVVGLETSLALGLDRLVGAGVIPLPRLIELMSTGPARVLGLPGGTLAAGAPADVTVIDLDRELDVVAARFASKSRNTPFAGWKLRGRAVATIVGGRVVWRLDAAE